MANKEIVQHSYSALNTFETCPRQYFHLKVKKDVKGSFSADSNYGLDVHKSFEDRMLKDKKLPLDLQHHEKIMAKVAAAPGEASPEQKLAINRNFEPTGFFDSDVWLRSIVDYTKATDKTCLVIDWKTGKMKSDFDQVSLCTATMSCFLPEVEKYTAAYYWTKEKRFTSIKLAKEELPNVWNEFLPRLERVEKAAKEDDFPTKPNGLCKKYCPVKQCKYNGV
jgi:hypothetical protein